MVLWRTLNIHGNSQKNALLYKLLDKVIWLCNLYYLYVHDTPNTASVHPLGPHHHTERVSNPGRRRGRLKATASSVSR